MQRSQYAMKKLAEIKGIRAPLFTSPHFKEFVVSFKEAGKTVEEINQFLLECNIFGGVDLSPDFPELESCALYCVTEVHTKEDIDHLVRALRECVE
jgi:glycine dehydrogenase subunit 1